MERAEFLYSKLPIIRSIDLTQIFSSAPLLGFLNIGNLFSFRAPPKVPKKLKLPDLATFAESVVARTEPLLYT